MGRLRTPEEQKEFDEEKFAEAFNNYHYQNDCDYRYIKVFNDDWF